MPTQDFCHLGRATWADRGILVLPCYVSPTGDIDMSPEIKSEMSASGTRRRLAILRGLVAGMILASSLGSPSVAQDEKQGGRIVLDIPVRERVPEDSKEHRTIVVRGMKKSRSGAT